MALLYYWRPDNYRQDAEFGFGFHLNQNSPAMLKAHPGDGLWAFTRRKDGAYALAAHLIVKGITYNVPRYRYGKYRLWADQRRSRYFDVEASPQSESIIRSLSIRADARHLGQSFQGNAAVRELTPADDLLLAQAAVGLPVIQTAEFFPRTNSKPVSSTAAKSAPKKSPRTPRPAPVTSTTPSPRPAPAATSGRSSRCTQANARSP